MARVTITKLIEAPIERVFQAVADIGHFSKAIPHIIRIEYLSGDRPAMGTRFRETRLNKGKETTTELEITDYTENDHVRLVADSHGTVWDTLFTVSQDGPHTELKVIMEARAHHILPKLINPLIMGMVRKAIEADIESVKSYCEK